MSMFRRHLVIVKSHCRRSGVVLRDPLTEKTVNTFTSLEKCKSWCRQNGWPASMDKSGAFSSNELREHEAMIPDEKD
jgi:hypothetical protein